MSGYAINSLLKKASELAIASAAKNSSSLKANKKRDSISSVPTLCEQNQLVIGNRLNFVADRLCK